MIKTINTVIILLFLHSIAFATNNVNISEILITESRTYHKTKRTWKNVYHELTKNGSSVRGATFIAPVKGNGYNDSKHKNGARNTIIFVPQKTNFNEDVDLIFYFHGLGGFKERDFKTRVLRHTKALEAQGRNFIVIIPEMPWSKNTNTPRTRQGRVFTRKGQFSTFVNSIVKITVTLFEPSPVKRNNCIMHNKCQFNFGDAILIGHSAGGSTLMSISRSGGLNWLYSVAKVGFVKVIFSDASYGYWLDIAWKYFKPTVTQSGFVVLTRKFDRPHKNAKRFLKKFRKKPENIRHIVFNRKITHADIGDQSFKWAYPVYESGCGEGVK